MSAALCRTEIVVHTVLSAAVVPERDVSRLPVVVYGELIACCVCDQVPEEFGAVRFVHADDVLREESVDEDRVAAGLGMSPHHGMHALLHGLPPRTMQCLERLDACLQFVVERVVGGRHA